MKIATLILAGALGLAGSFARAQDGPQLNVGLLAAQGNAATMTRQIWGGYSLQLGYQFTPENLGVSVRPYLGWGILAGKKNLADRTPSSVWGPNSYNLTCWTVGTDFIFTPFQAPLKLFTGPSLHLWQVERIDGTIPNMGNQNWRAGWRLGAEYPVMQDLSVGVAYTLTEWNTETTAPQNWEGYKDLNTTPSFIDGVNPSRPAYFTVYASYRF